jgi:HTH-type transcriptional regulator / antitoxin HipB
VRIGDSTELGHYIKERRTALGLTQARVAAAAEVSRRWLSDLEAGKASAEFGRVLRTLHALDVVVDLQTTEDVAMLKQSFAGLDAALRYSGGDEGGLEPVTDVDLARRTGRAARSRRP